MVDIREGRRTSKENDFNQSRVKYREYRKRRARVVRLRKQRPRDYHLGERMESRVEGGRREGEVK